MRRNCVDTQATPECGVTLLELLVTLLIASIITAWALPSYQALGEQTAHASEINRLQTAFSLARNTAISQRSAITVCPASLQRDACNRDWGGELLIVQGDKTDSLTEQDIVRVVPAQQHTQVAYSRGWSRIRYSTLGYTSGYNGSFAICSGSRSQGTKLVLSQLGRLRIDEEAIEC